MPGLQVEYEVHGLQVACYAMPPGPMGAGPPGCMAASPARGELSGVLEVHILDEHDLKCVHLPEAVWIQIFVAELISPKKFTLLKCTILSQKV